VLFVCDGNICRSPMAAEYLRHRAAHDGLSHLVVDSAGLLGIEGAPAAAHAVTVLKEAGLDLSRHRSRGLTSSDLQIADFVIVMTLRHLEQLAVRSSIGAERRFLVRAFEQGKLSARGAPDLDDPVTGPLEGFRKAFGVIRTSVDHLILHLKHET